VKFDAFGVVSVKALPSFPPGDVLSSETPDFLVDPL
jgi:hypothetical protein